MNKGIRVGKIVELEKLARLTGVSDDELSEKNEAFEYLSQNINPNEKLYYCMTTGPIYGIEQSMGVSVIAVTNKRIVFAGQTSGYVKRISTFSIGLDSVVSVDAEAGWVSYTMWITTTGSKLKCTFVGIASNRCKDNAAYGPTIINGFDQAIHRAIEENKQASAMSQVSPADEVRKYKELLDMGAITQAEFDAKKKQLLGL